MTISLFILGITLVLSFLSFSNQRLLNNCVLYPALMHDNPREWYRFITSGFVHLNTTHLLVNMLTFYFFAPNLEETIGSTWFAFLYISAIIVADMPSFIKHKNNPSFRSLGASGAIAAVIFAGIYIAPWQPIEFLMLPIKIPSIIFGVLYVAYTKYMSMKNMGNINHDAHLGGAIYGFLVMIIIDPNHGVFFLNQITHPVFY